MGLSSLSVLIADDSQNLRTLIATVVRSTGVGRVYEASDGADALSLLTDTPCDIAIVDLSMPVVDGLEFTSFVRRSPSSKNPFMPIVLMTAHSERSRVMAARDAGVTEVLAKPVSTRSILLRLIACIDHPRSFIKSVAYVGPDRRRRSDPNYKGPPRRQADLGVNEIDV